MKIKSITPCGRRILVKQDKVENTTKGGILLPDDVTAREQNGEYRGEVLAIGPLAWRDLYVHAGMEFEPWCKVGDKILFHRYAHTRTNPEEEDMRIIINDSDIIAVIEVEEEEG